jgi:hypothetical protein
MIPIPLVVSLSFYVSSNSSMRAGRVSRNFQSGMILGSRDHVKESWVRGSPRLPIVGCSKRKTRQLPANSRMPSALAAQAKVFQNLEEEDTMKPSTQDKAEGTFHEVKGKIKEKERSPIIQTWKTKAATLGEQHTGWCSEMKRGTRVSRQIQKRRAEMQRFAAGVTELTPAWG